MAKEMSIGLVGFGVVGTGMLQCLAANQKQIEERVGSPVRVKTIADLDIITPRDFNTKGIKLTTDVNDILSDPEIDIVVELIGGTGFAYDLISNALKAGKDVITANKALLAHRGHDLFQLAREKKRLLLFEAAVGGGIPIIQALRTGICSTAVDRIYGILNGTANYILTRMEDAHLNFDVALIEAKAKGYAEADPTFDIEGHDTTHKIMLLSQLAFGCRVSFEDVHREGITRLTFFDLQMAYELGYRVKLLAVARRDGERLDIRCHPALVPLESQLAAVSGVFNAIVVMGRPLGTVMFYGPGAGGPATGAAVAADIMEAGRQIAHGHDRINNYSFDHTEMEIKPAGEINSAFYMKINVLDRPGVVAQVAAALAEESISIASFIQKERREAHEAVPIVITTHEARQSAMDKAVERISTLESVVERPFLVRIENFQ